jgi:pyrroline-5-carboxylate reductase
MRLGVIGYGKMGASLVKGGLRSGIFKPEGISVVETDGWRQETARADGLKTVGSLAGLSPCGAILLSVKPKDFPTLLEQVRSSLDPAKHLFISIAAGVTLASLEEGLGSGSRIARAMPNIPASSNEAASVYVMNGHATARDRRFVKRFLDSVGKSYELEDEGLVNSATGVSGSGPAYFFLMMGAMESAGVSAGFPRELARSLVAQTCRGAGTLALESSLSMAELTKAVASPGGTTEEALKVLESKGFSAAVAEAIAAAIEKSKRMGRR